MAISKTLGSVYVVTWPGLVKAGKAHSKARWRHYEARGATLAGVWHYREMTDADSASRHETAAHRLLDEIAGGVIELSEAPWLHQDGNGRWRADGYLETYRAVDVSDVVQQVGGLLVDRGGRACVDPDRCGRIASDCVTPDELKAVTDEQDRLRWIQREEDKMQRMMGAAERHAHANASNAQA